MKYNSFKMLLILRYFIYFTVAFSIIFLSEPPISKIPMLTLYLLLYIINTQVRIYIIKNKNILTIASLLFEILIISLLYYNFGGFTFIYYFIGIMDAVMLLPKKQAVILNILFYISTIFQSMTPFYKNLQNYPVINVIFNTLIVFGFGTLGIYFNEENNRKHEAQLLYDKVRISEEKLKEAYSKLEQYSETANELAILRERNRISREIHDTVGHTLSTLIIQLDALPFIIKASPEKADEMIKNMLSYTKTGLEDVRRAVKELSPKGFDTSNGIFVIQELIYNFQKNSGVKVRFWTSKNMYNLTSDQSFTLYRVIQESLNNSIRHGGATIIEININFSEEEIFVRIKDNGTGTADVTQGFGLSHMQQRINSLGGTITFKSSSGDGFETAILLPRVQDII